MCTIISNKAKIVDNITDGLYFIHSKRPKLESIYNLKVKILEVDRSITYKFEKRDFVYLEKISLVYV